MEEIIDKCHKLDQTFTLWFHNPNDINWDISSYHEILNFSTVEEFWTLFNLISSNLVENGMLFLMKETINPIWEDEHNINGGCISFKLDKQNSYKIWENYIIHLVSNNLDEKVNGVSISPKRNFNIIKLWISEEIEVSNFNIPKTMLIPNDNILFRSHKINIEKDKKKQAK